MSQKVLVTGASSGFGALIVDTLLSKGHTIVATLRDAATRNKAKAEALEKRGVHTVELDVTDEASVQKGVAEALRKAGGLDVVVNNAGVGVVGWQEAFTADDWRRLFDINVFGVQRVNRAVLGHMRERRRGLLIHVSSLLGRMVLPFYGPYNASKFALEALADNYRVELGGLGIESVIVEPGGYGTDFSKNLLQPSDPARAKGYGPMAEAPVQALRAFEKIFENPNPPNPQAVADAVARLVDLPRGQRPFRTEVDKLGMGDAIAPYNKSIEDIQKNIYTAFGMGDMLKLNLS